MVGGNLRSFCLKKYQGNCPVKEVGEFCVGEIKNNDPDQDQVDEVKMISKTPFMEPCSLDQHS